MIRHQTLGCLLLTLNGLWGGALHGQSTFPEPGAREGQRVWVATRNSGIVAVIDPETDQLVRQITSFRGGSQEGLAAAKGVAWVTDFSGWIHRVDAGSLTVTATSRGFGYAAEVAASPSTVWVSNGDFAWISRVDPRSGAVDDSVEVGWSVLDLAISGGSVWVASDGARGGQLSRIPIAGSEPADIIELDWRPEALVVGFGSLWVHDPGFGMVHRFDLGGGPLPAHIPLGAEMHEGKGIASGEGAIWVALGMEEAVARIDPSSGALTRIPLGGFVQDVAAGAGAVWVVLPEDDLLAKINPTTLEVLARIPVDGYPVMVIVG